MSIKRQFNVLKGKTLGSYIRKFLKKTIFSSAVKNNKLSCIYGVKIKNHLIFKNPVPTVLKSKVVYEFFMLDVIEHRV